MIYFYGISRSSNSIFTTYSANQYDLEDVVCSGQVMDKNMTNIVLCPVRMSFFFLNNLSNEGSYKNGLLK